MVAKIASGCPFNSLVVLACLAMCVLGCGEPNIQQPTFPVTGEIKLDGKPLKGATIVLHAVDQTKFKWKELPQGTSDDQGQFSLFTYESNDGAPEGEYKVGIALLPTSNEEGGDQVRREKGMPKLPTKYADPNTSGVTVKVERKSTELPPLQLSSK